jgi:ubiquinone/menaquinone biosynthesis C-methylase UbiE
VDASAEMIALARANIHAARLTDRIAVDLVDAKTLPYDDMSFPAIMSNSIVHHIPEPRTVLAEMVRVAAPGAVIFVRDLLRPEGDAEVARLVALHAGGCNAHQRQLFDDSLRAALSLTEIRDRIVSLGFAAESVQQTTDRHWTWVATVPASASPSARC